MKRIITITILWTLFFSQTTKACCAGDYIGIFPRGANISVNTTFLIDFSERDFALETKMTNLLFTAISKTGKQYKLSVLATNFSGTMGQVFLKVNSKLKLGDTISIRVSLLNDDTLSGKTINFARGVSWRKWAVTFRADNDAPIWTNDTIAYSTYDSRNSSAPGYSVNFNPKVTDNSVTNDKYKINGKSSQPFFYEVTLNNQKFICSADGGYPGIYYSICGSNFSFGIDQSYTATVKIIDASGNYSQREKILVFKTTGTKERIIIFDK